MSSRILVVDDERHIVRLIEANLSRNGHVVLTAFDGYEAIGLLRTEPFDRAILDYGMPEPNGYQVLEFIRTREETRSMWVGLLVSGPEMELVKGLEHKADWYSGKAFDPSML